MRSDIYGIILLLTFSAQSVFSGVLEDARSLESSGRFSEALGEYISWLDTHSGDERFAAVLIHTAALSENPQDSLQLLNRYVLLLAQSESGRVFSRMAALESTLGLLQEAAEHYEKASASGGSESDQWHYDSLSIRFSMGEYVEVRKEALELSRETDSGLIRDESVALAALSLLFTAREENSAAALDEISRYVNKTSAVVSAQVWLALYVISSSAGDTEAGEYAKTSLERYFPDSVAAYIAEQRVPLWDTPAVLMDMEKSLPRKSVQIGAFSNRDSASSLRHRLEEDHFISWIEQNGNLWRVYVNDPDGDVLDRLRAGGYELLF